MADPTSTLQVIPVVGIGQISPDDDLAAVIAAALPDLDDGDIIVVTSKVVSKAEGRVLSATDRAETIAAETLNVVASRDELQIVRTHHGLVLAAAGVDASNTPPGSVVLLPTEPDASARKLRTQLAERTGHRIGVVISDTAGRAWRLGQTDIAIGAAGIAVTVPHQGQVDSYGNPLVVTEPAVADEIAGAADLVMGKTSQCPAAVVRGLAHLVTVPDGAGASSIVRPLSDDLFALGTQQVVSARRTVREFTDEPVSTDDILHAIADAVTAPAPHHTTPWRFVILENSATRTALLDAMADQWRRDLGLDGRREPEIERRVARGEILRRAPAVVVPCLVTAGSHDYPDERRSTAEREMFLLAMGAGIENFLVSLAAQRLGSAWVSSTLFCSEVVRQELDLPSDWEPMGAVAIGRAASAAKTRPSRRPDDYTVFR